MNTAYPKIHYMSSPMKIGKTLWRLVIKEYVIYGELEEGQKRLCNEYQWNEKGQWQPSSKWSTYNSNDTYYGMPRRLSRLYDREKDLVDFWIHGKPIAQGKLFE